MPAKYMCDPRGCRKVDSENSDSSNSLGSFECQEPRCTSRATKDWAGRKVCDDHYDKYRDEQDRHYYDMH